jgi:predicted short-subunit dehydrogenase-like oxidoreductase (DUF2520 family)
LIYLHGGSVIALASRNRIRAEGAAAFIGPSVRPIGSAELPSLATHVLIAVKDEGITLVAEELARAGMRTGVALHTCGAKGLDALAPLKRAGVACGVLHPLQTVPTPEQGVKSLRGVTYGIAGDRLAVEWAEDLVSLLGGRALRVAPEHLTSYHAGAVMASNALVAVIDAAVVLMGQAGVERDAALRALEPLARSSLDNVFANGPSAALTGPVVRGDAGTVAAHMDALDDAPPTVAALYVAAARRLIEIARERDLSEASVRALKSALRHDV